MEKPKREKPEDISDDAFYCSDKNFMPCPFCGSVWLNQNAPNWGGVISCESCPATNSQYYWNTRLTGDDRIQIITAEFSALLLKKAEDFERDPSSATDITDLTDEEYLEQLLNPKK